MGDSGTGGGGGSTSGSCIYFHTGYNRMLCDPVTSSSGCSGKFTAGGTCRNFSCPSETRNPNLCSDGGGSGGSGSCTSTYQGPTGDPQVATQCMSVWNYRCQANNPSAADQNCLVYRSMDPTVPCPYCP